MEEPEGLHIGFDATAIPPNRAGAGIYIFNLVQSLAQVDTRNRYTVFAQPAFIAEFGIAQPNFEFVAVACESTWRRMAWEQVSLPKQVRHRKIDILHSPHYTMPFRLPCRSVVTYHDMTWFTMPEVHGRFRRVFFRGMMRWSGRRADRLIAVSESTRRDIHAVLGTPLTKIVAISLAASPAFRALPPSQAAEVCVRYGLEFHRYALFVGVLEPRKNVPVLLEAYARLTAVTPDLPLAVVGKKGWMYDEIFARVTALGLQKHVFFLGYVPEDDLVALYNGARVFVYPSQYEGFGLPVLEALQCGTPVITSNVSSMPEVAGDDAILVSPGDVSDLTEALQRMVSDDALARDLSVRGIERARQFSWQRCARETLAVYRSLCEVHSTEE